jgi:hypothetical protein
LRHRLSLRGFYGHSILWSYSGRSGHQTRAPWRRNSH